MDEWQAKTYGLIQAHLDTAVPAIMRQLIEVGGPTSIDFERVRGYSIHLATHGDAVLFRDKGTTSEAMSKLAEGIAVMAFCPGGIRIFGLEFDGRKMAQQMRQTRAEVYQLSGGDDALFT